MKNFILLGCLIVVVVAGIYMSHRMQISNFHEKLQTVINKDQGITEIILKAETESSEMTYGELFEFCDKSVNDRIEMIIELRGLYPDKESVLKDSLMYFLNEENKLVRLKVQSYRKYLDVSTGKDSYKEIQNSYIHSNEYNRKMYFKMYRESLSKIMGDIGNMEYILHTFREKYEILTEMEKSIESLMNNEGLKFTPIFSKYQEANQAYVKTSLKYALSVESNL
jgi:hypothetical protein